MNFTTPLVSGRLVRRYKRFLADIILDGETTQITAHCANPGAMIGLDRPGLKVWLEPVNNPKRKLRWSWRITELEDGALVGMDTSLPNRIVREALEARALTALDGYDTVRPEVPYGTGSRVDFLLTDSKGARPSCFVEVKNVHLMRTPGLAEFPDCVTARGTKHMGELARAVVAGNRAVLLYLVQREDCGRFMVASDLDPSYEIAYLSAQEDGVEIQAYTTLFHWSADRRPAGIEIGQPIPISSPS